MELSDHLPFHGGSVVTLELGTGLWHAVTTTANSHMQLSSCVQSTAVTACMHCIWLLFLFPLPLWLQWLDRRDCGVDVLFRTKKSASSVHVDPLKTTGLIPIFCLKMLRWWELIGALIYVSNSSSLGVSLNHVQW